MGITIMATEEVTEDTRVAVVTAEAETPEEIRAIIEEDFRPHIKDRQVPQVAHTTPRANPALRALKTHTQDTVMGNKLCMSRCGGQPYQNSRPYNFLCSVGTSRNSSAGGNATGRSWVLRTRSPTTPSYPT